MRTPAESTNTVIVAVASGSDELTPRFLDAVQSIYPQLPLYVVSEFPSPNGHWIPFHPKRGFQENLTRARVMLRGKSIRFAAVLFEPKQPYGWMRLLGFLLAPLYFAAFNPNLDHFMLRPRSLPNMAGHFVWRVREWFVFQFNAGGEIYTFFWRLGHPKHFRRPVRYFLARQTGRLAALVKAVLPAAPLLAAPDAVESGLREGVTLLTTEELTAPAAAALAGCEVIVLDAAAPSLAAAANGGLSRTRTSHVCVLDGTVRPQPDMLAQLRRAFDDVPDLFCATARIDGCPTQTGKTSLPPFDPESRAYPLRHQPIVEGENCTYVPHGHSTCSLYSTARLRALGGFDEAYKPAFCEDLDAGYRAWLQGWPSVLVTAARVNAAANPGPIVRRLKPEAIELTREVNFVRFLMRATGSARLFRQLWFDNAWRLNLAAAGHHPSFLHIAALGFATRAARWLRRVPKPTLLSESHILALGSGDVCVFPGRVRRPARKVVLVASPYLPFPLSHGGAVRIFNLMRRAAEEHDQVLVVFSDDEVVTPPRELLDLCVEIVVVRRLGSHIKPTTDRPDMVEEFDLPAYRAALRQTVRKWRPAVAQLEFTQMAQYAADCAPARTVLVEHDITFDLQQQLLAHQEDWEIRRQYERWLRFETAAWKQVDCVVVMSEKDRRAVQQARSTAVIANGVDIERFQPAGDEPEPARLLFIGSFRHTPNIAAIDFFLRQVWPRLDCLGPRRRLHIIAGSNHRYFLSHYRDRTGLHLDQPEIEVEDFVSDVRPAYRRAAVVIAPLLASAGTNIKIMEAMAMGKAIVSTPPGINGLDLSPGRDVLVAETAETFAAAIVRLVESPDQRRAMEREARATVERQFDWDRIAEEQQAMYERLGRADG